MFFLFSLAASAVYLINDIIDIERDKQHRIKRLRPLASGKISIFQAKITAFILGTTAILFSFILDIYAGWIIVVYIILNYIYTKILKNIIIIDVFCIGAFFYLRILAGAIVSDVVLSKWIVLCTVLIALFLALNKRRHDAMLTKEAGYVYIKYSGDFAKRIIFILAFAIVIAYVLYTIGSETIERFGTNHLIFTIPFVCYGIFRYLYLVDKRGLGDDPAHLLLKDYKMQLNLALWITTCIAIIYFKL